MSESVPTAFLPSPDVDKLEDWGPLEQADGPGNTAVFPAGWTGTWEIHETVRKLYVFY